MSNKMKLSAARKLLEIAQGKPCAAGNHLALFEQMVADGVLQTKSNKSRLRYSCSDQAYLESYLKEKFGIIDLERWIAQKGNKPADRAMTLQASIDEKSVGVKPFQGFLVQTIQAMELEIERKKVVLNSPKGSSLFIHDWKTFTIPSDYQVVIVENFENFKYLEQQRAVFEEGKYLFIFRFYDRHQSLLNWLQAIGNPILYFGDWDFGGIKIFMSEFHKKLPDRCEFFIPDNLESLLQEKGNRMRYHQQLQLIKTTTYSDIPNMKILTDLFHSYKKVLAQEVMITL